MKVFSKVVVMGEHASGTAQAKVHKLPVPGESISAYDFNIIKDGGKASHKAIILSNYGMNVSFIGLMGTDQRSKIGIQWLIDSNIDISNLLLIDDYRIPGASSLMLLDDDGNNMIIMVDSVKKRLSFEQAEPLIHNCKDGQLFITDFEIPFSTAINGMKLAKSLGMFTILNPSPIPSEPMGELDYVDLICPNEIEAKMMLSMDEAEDYDPIDLCKRLVAQYKVKHVIITMGSDGAIYYNEKETVKLPPLKIKAVDPSGAGDVFISSFIYSHYFLGQNVYEAMNWANHAAALSVTRSGSIDSFPTIEEVNQYTKDYNEYNL